MYYLRKSIEGDAQSLSTRLREADLREVEAWGSTPIQALTEGFELSDPCLSAVNDVTGEVVMMFGVVPDAINKTCGSVWLLSDEVIFDSAAVTFLRGCRGILKTIGRDYTCLYNAVHVENAVHIKWLRWLGFTILDPVEFVPGQFFHPFVRKTNV